MATALELGAQDSSRVFRSRTAYEDLQMFSQVFNQIRVNHPDSVDTHALFMAAIEGMVRATDPHSYVLPAARLSPERYDALRKGQLYPIPIDFTYVGDAPLVVSVRPGTAATTLDILTGDELIGVDDQPITAESAAELEIALAGKKGSTVKLTLRRRRWDGGTITVDRTVKRERASEESAIGAAFLLDGTTGYLRLIHFDGPGIGKAVHDSLKALERRGMRRLVFDLRDNPGGRIDEAADVAGEFLPKGAMIYTTEGRKQNVSDTARVKRSTPRERAALPLVVIVNAGTASAAELVSGALQDHDRALILGQPTFGKSLLMQGFPLTDGSFMHLVIGHVKTPCGRIVQRQYRELRTREYLRLAGSVADTTGRPSCRTASGRVVYGGAASTLTSC